MVARRVILSSSPDPPASGAREPRKAAIAFIFITIVLDVLAMGIVIPVLPKLVESFLHHDTGKAAIMYGLFGTTWAVMQFFAGPILGSISDRYGRRRVILMSCLGLGLDYCFMGWAPSLGWLFVGRVISGITAAGLPTAMAYISDVSTPEKRAANFGIVGAAFGLGFILGPAFGGLLGSISPRLPFWIAGALTLVNVAYGAFVLPESLPADQRRAFDWGRANPLGSLRLLRSRKGLLGLATVYFLYMLSHQVLQNVAVLYTGFRYGWDARAVGLSMAVVGVFSVIVQGGLVRLAVERFGERRVLLFGVAGGVCGYTAYAFASTGALYLLFIPIFAMMFFTGPPLQGLMSRRVAHNEFGLLQGTNSSIMGLAGIIGPSIFTRTFAMFIRPHRGFMLPGAPYLVAAACMVTAWVIAERASRGAARGADGAPAAVPAGH